MNFRPLGTGGIHQQEPGSRPGHHRQLQPSIAWEALDGNQTWLTSRQGLLWIPGLFRVLLQWSSTVFTSWKKALTPPREAAETPACI